MSFSGDLEHLPIVDVIQLMNTSRKSGILSINGRKGESQLVFKEGYIVSANHLNNSVRIGALLVKSGIIREQQLEEALLKQKSDGADRKPLIITLIEMGLVNEDDAYKGLQQLIEMTIVEVLSWKKGTFTLEALSKSVECEFRYYPTKMNLEINLNTQNMLMDALCAYDEMMRDGLLPDEPEEQDEGIETLNELLSEDDLGLSELEQIPAQLHKPFSGVTPFNPLAFQKERLAEMAPGLSAVAKETLALFLASKTVNPELLQPGNNHVAPVILFSPDRLLIHCLTTVCNFYGVNITHAASSKEMDDLLAIWQTEKKRKVLLFDYPVSSDPASTSRRASEIRKRINQQLPDSFFLQLAPVADFNFAMESYKTGVQAVIPKPLTNDHQNSNIEELILFLEVLPPYLSMNSV